MPTAIVIGVQWGDEGKGKVIDLLAGRAQHIVRAQGGNNAGHTVLIGKEEYRFHLLPSGIIYPHTHCYIGGGTAIDPAVLLAEIEGLEKRGISVRGRLAISPYANIVFPYHRDFDKLYEQQKGALAIGTTGRGIGPCYADRANRVGMRMCELISPEIFKERLRIVVVLKNQELEKIFDRPLIDEEALHLEYSEYGKRLAPFVSNMESAIQVALKKNETVLFEGAHGTYLDLTFGTYPYVTSSSTLSAGICAGAGVGPSRIDHVLGVVKAYTTRVGNGPLPSALSKEEEQHFLDPLEAREIGTTTGRKRRLGWFDAPLVRYAMGLNGVDSMAITKLDILDSLPILKICTGYRFKGKTLDVPPALVEEFEKVEPLYEELPGWRVSTRQIGRLEDLPKNARHYLDRLQELCQVPISLISLGPGRENSLFLQNIFNS